MQNPEPSLALIGLVGVLFLLAVAVTIGILENHARREAWNRIARARRSQAERSRMLDVRERELDLRRRRPEARTPVDH